MPLLLGLSQCFALATGDACVLKTLDWTVRQVWRKYLYHLTTPDLQGALEACVAALEAMDRPDTALLCSVYEALARTLSSSSSAADDGAKAEELCLRAITALDRPDNKPQGVAAAGAGAGAGAGGGKGAGGAKGARGTIRR